MHTIGPWTSKPEDEKHTPGCISVLAIPSSIHVADVIHSYSVAANLVSADEAEANACLIAAAPELLGALEAILPHLPEAWSVPGAAMHGRVRAAQAAIAKATGST